MSITTVTPPTAKTTLSARVARAAEAAKSGNSAATMNRSEAHTTAGGGGEENSTVEPNTQVERTVGLTTFIDNQNTLSDERPTPVMTNTITSLRQQHQEGQDIQRIAARPVFIANLTWSAASPVGTLLGFNNLPLDLLNISTIKKEKMQRYQFFSADIVIRIIASTMSFQAGRLWISFEAARQQRGARRTGLNMQSLTALDGIEFDPTVPSPVELRLRYFAPMSEWERNGQYGFGTILYSVLAPLSSASTSSSASFSVQGWFENVTFGVPTQDPFETIAPARNLVRAFKQSNAERNQAERSHVVSDTLDTVSEIAGAMGTFPLLSAIATPVSWATGVAARAARMFGFSKPGVSNAPIRAEIFPQSTAHHMDGSSDAVMLAASSGYREQEGPVFGTDQDEMDIAYICSRMPNIASYTWRGTDAIGANIGYIPVMPGLCTRVENSGDVSYGVYNPTPMAYVASMFKFWAGSLKFRLEAVSTPFHAGRLLVSYVPNFNPFSTYSITEASNNYTILWDITTSSHIEFEVPYMSNVPYLQTFIDQPDLIYLKNGETTGTDVEDRLRKLSNGAIVFFVLNQLVAPDTAASAIEILAWMGGGKDITFAEPTLGEFVPSVNRDFKDRATLYYDDTVMVNPSTNVPFARSDQDEHPEQFFDIVERPIRQSLRAQPYPTRDYSMQHAVVPAVGPDPNMAGSAQNDANFEQWMPMKYISPMERAKLCRGECITNLRYLTRRMCPSYALFPQSVTEAGALNRGLPTSNHVLCFDLDFFSLISKNHDNAIYENGLGALTIGGRAMLRQMPTFLSYISYLYTYVRGTRRFLITSRASNVINGAPFISGTTRLADMTDPASHRNNGEFDVRISPVVSDEQYTYMPWFRPDDCIYEYNNANTTFSTISDNFKYGLGSLYSSDAYVKRIGSEGTGLEVSVPTGTTLPVRLLADPDKNPAAWNSEVKAAIPRLRRFLEIRYRPHSTAPAEVTSNFPGITWPMPTLISEAAGDDLSFGFLQQAPKITRINKTHIFSKSDGTVIRL